MRISSLMTRTTPYLFVSAAVFLLAHCQTDSKSPKSSGNPPEITSETYVLGEGDSLNFFEFKAEYPVVKKGTDALRDSVQQWVENCVAEICAQTEDSAPPKLRIDESANALKTLWKTPENTVAHAFNLKDTVLMVNQQFVVLRLDLYLNNGGAHPNYLSRMVVFNSQTGAVIPVTDFIKDPNAILPLLDIAYRAEKQEAFAEGNAYIDSAIVFPTQCVFTEKGVLFHYNTYEIAPYALGDADIFMTWTDLGQSAVNPTINQ
jgi:hypothetical protein